MNLWRGLRGLPGQIWLVCAAELINRAGSMALVFLVLYLTQEKHWTPESAGAVMLAYGLSRMVSGPFTGRLIDRFGPVPILKVSLWGSGLAIAALPFVTSQLLTFATLAAWAVFAQSGNPSSMALLAGLAPPDRRRAVFALQRLATNLGMAVGPAVGGFLAHARFSWVFWVDGITSLAAALFLTANLAPAPRESAPAGATASRSAWRDKRLAYLLLSFLPILLVFFQTEGALPLWVVRDMGFDTRFYGLLFTVNTILIVLFEVALNLAMAKKWSHGRQLMLGAACVAVGFGSVSIARNAASLLGVVVVWTLGEMILLPAASDAVASLAPPERRGEYMGLFSTTFAVGLSLGPWLGVLSYARFGGMATWVGCLALGLVSVFLLGRFDAVMRRWAA